MTSFRVIQGCPFPTQIAGYFGILVADTGATVNSGYRGTDARDILHRHGKRDQAEIYRDLPAGTANPPGFSSHEGFSDGNPFYRVPRGQRLAWWQIGIDVNDTDVPKMIRAAKARGWVLAQPYKSGVETHHLNFARRPRPKGPRTVAKLIATRARLPKR